MPSHLWGESSTDRAKDPDVVIDQYRDLFWGGVWLKDFQSRIQLPELSEPRVVMFFDESSGELLVLESIRVVGERRE